MLGKGVGGVVALSIVAFDVARTLIIDVSEEGGCEAGLRAR